jgi:hypothetical protein
MCPLSSNLSRLLGVWPIRLRTALTPPARSTGIPALRRRAWLGAQPEISRVSAKLLPGKWLNHTTGRISLRERLHSASRCRVAILRQWELSGAKRPRSLLRPLAVKVIMRRPPSRAALSRRSFAGSAGYVQCAFDDGTQTDRDGQTRRWRGRACAYVAGKRLHGGRRTCFGPIAAVETPSEAACDRKSP